MKKKPTYEELERKIEELEQRILEQGRAYESQVEDAAALQSLLNALTESAMLVDLEGRIVTINEIGAQRLGNSVSEMIGTELVDHFPPELTSYRKAWGEEVVRTGKPVRFQDERAGRFYDTHDYPVFDRQGKVRAIAIYSRDITENPAGRPGFAREQRELPIPGRECERRDSDCLRGRRSCLCQQESIRNHRVHDR